MAERSKAGDSSSLHLLMARVRTPPTVSFACTLFFGDHHLLLRVLHLNLSPAHDLATADVDIQLGESSLFRFNHKHDVCYASGPRKSAALSLSSNCDLLGHRAAGFQ